MSQAFPEFEEITDVLRESGATEADPMGVDADDSERDFWMSERIQKAIEKVVREARELGGTTTLQTAIDELDDAAQQQTGAVPV